MSDRKQRGPNKRQKVKADNINKEPNTTCAKCGEPEKRWVELPDPGATGLLSGMYTQFTECKPCEVLNFRFMKGPDKCD